MFGDPKAEAIDWDGWIGENVGNLPLKNVDLH